MSAACAKLCGNDQSNHLHLPFNDQGVEVMRVQRADAKLY